MEEEKIQKDYNIVYQGKGEEKMTITFNGPKLEVKLICQVPLIHFQPESKGATLRASEVKPKLDRFIIKHCKSIQKEWKVNPSKDALNYKLKFEDKHSKVENIKENPLYYAGGDKELVRTNPVLTIICFIPSLQEVLAKHLEDFFIVTNFGTMQGKGFGSFLVEGSKKDILSTLKKEFHLSKIHRVETAKNFKDQMTFIKQFYTLTKSGNNSGSDNEYKRSALFTYMHGQGIDNEKAYLKQEGILEKVGNHTPAHIQPTSNPKYVRIVLGQGFQLTVRERNGRRGVLDRVAINHKYYNKKEHIQRFASPLTFKIINNIIYIIPKSIPNKIFNQTYTFFNKNKDKKVTLKTPESFNLQAFTDYAVEYYNKAGKVAFPKTHHMIKS